MELPSKKKLGIAGIVFAVTGVTCFVLWFALRPKADFLYLTGGMSIACSFPWFWMIYRGKYSR